MKEMMVILDGNAFRTALRRVRREFQENNFVLVEQRDGTVLVIRHDVAVRENFNRRVECLPKPPIHFYSFQELVGEALRRGFAYISINDGDGWPTRLPIADVVRGYIPRFWAEYKFRFYRNASVHWSDSMTLYPDGNNFFYHVKELF